MELHKRKSTRLKGYDYSSPGAYFITICVKGRKQLLSKIIVGGDAHIAPKNELSEYGRVCDKYIKNINNKYENVSVDKYVIMPNHIHLLISLNGTMWASSPTIIQNPQSILFSYNAVLVVIMIIGAGRTASHK